MNYGIICQYFPEKGFGFIRPDRGEDIFFHVTAIGACRQPIQVRLGQPVKYELIPGTEPKPKRRRYARSIDDEEETPAEKPVRPQAKFVELLDKLPGAILTESIPAGNPRHPKSRRRKPTWRAVQEATGQEVTGQEATGQEATGLEATGLEATGQDSEEQDSNDQD
jgi:cold shock CspA family protein